jgi:hypothetical protein
MLERRDPVGRAAFVRAVLTDLVYDPRREFTTEAVQDLLRVTPEIATRILQRLRDAGLFQEVRRGMWVRVPITTVSDPKF